MGLIRKLRRRTAVGVVDSQRTARLCYRTLFRKETAAVPTSSEAALRLRRVALLVLPDSYPGCSACALDVLQIANVQIRNRVQQVIPGAPRRRSIISYSILTLDAQPVNLFGRVKFAASEGLPTATRQFDAVVVPAPVRRTRGGLERLAQLPREAAVWLRNQHLGGAMMIASYTGVFLLAQAGLLDGRTAAVSLELESAFRQRFADVKPDTARAIVEDHDVVTGAGLGDHAQAVWTIVNRFRSGVIAAQTASALDLALHDAPDATLQHPDSMIGRAQHLMYENISAPLNMRRIARTLSVSERTLFRRFKSATGCTPNAWLQRVRIDSAKSSLELTNDSIATIAATTGYSDRAFFSEVFRQLVGMTPTDYRAQIRQVRPAARRRNTRVTI
jgi:transcriptional regulator GlxA family with amidase domain